MKSSVEIRTELEQKRKTLDEFASDCHTANLKWWLDPVTGRKIQRNKGEMIALMHSELSEMLEAVRKNLVDSHLPEYPGEVVELADLLIRAFDYAGALDMPLQAAFDAKMKFNRTRFDHSHEARLKYDGKKF